MAGVDGSTSTPSPLIHQNCETGLGAVAEDGSSLFILAEERQQREDERPDVGDVIQPIEEIHTRHLLPSRKKPTHRTACRVEYNISS